MPASLDAVKRDTRGKNEARRLRAAGQIPAVVYGGAEQARRRRRSEAAVAHPALGSGVNTLIGLTSRAAATTQVLVKEFLLDPVHHHLLHADFFRCRWTRPIT